MTPPRIVHGDCLEVMKMLPNDSVDSIVTDPPYGLGFMGKAWDALPPGQDWAEECLRVLKPGGHLLAFGGTRTWHRLAVAVEDAGFEMRDSLAWLYGSGFPKSLDVSKAIDKANGKHDRDLEPFGAYVKASRQAKGWSLRQVDEAMGTNTAASWWEGRKSGVQPPSVAVYSRLKDLLGMDGRYDELIEWVEAEREIVKERKMTQGGGTSLQIRMGEVREVQANITAPATPAAKQWQGWGTALKPAFEPVVMGRKPLRGTVAAAVIEFGTGAINIGATRNGERWPANVILDESQAEALDESKYFYTAKAPKSERPVVDGIAHPTVKPLALMRWLVRLVTPPGGTVLEPFAGSGATVEACILEGFHCIAIEREAEYLPLIQARIDRQDAA